MPESHIDNRDRGTRFQDTARRIAEAIRTEAKHGPGIAETEASLGLAPGYLRAAITKRNGRMPLDVVIQFADFLGLTLADLERPRPEPCAFVRKAKRRAHRGAAGDLALEEIEQLDGERYDAPEATARRVAAALKRCPSELIPALLGVWASCHRQMGDLDRAASACDVAIELAQGTDQLGQLLQRRGVVESAEGWYHRAIHFAAEAMATHSSRGDVTGVGKALCDQGGYWASMGKYERARRSYQSALALLPEEERRNRFYALHGTTAIDHLTGRTVRMSEVEEIVGLAETQLERGHALSLGGLALDDPEMMRSAADLLVEVSPADACIAYCDLAEMLLTKNLPLDELAEPLRALMWATMDSNSLITAAAREIVCALSSSSPREAVSKARESIRNQI